LILAEVAPFAVSTHRRYPSLASTALPSASHVANWPVPPSLTGDGTLLRVPAALKPLPVHEITGLAAALAAPVVPMTPRPVIAAIAAALMMRFMSVVLVFSS
jgi:hypothetical protein